MSPHQYCQITTSACSDFQSSFQVTQYWCEINAPCSFALKMHKTLKFKSTVTLRKISTQYFLFFESLSQRDSWNLLKLYHLFMVWEVVLQEKKNFSWPALMADDMLLNKCKQPINHQQWICWYIYNCNLYNLDTPIVEITHSRERTHMDTNVRVYVYDKGRCEHCMLPMFEKNIFSLYSFHIK